MLRRCLLILALLAALLPAQAATRVLHLNAALSVAGDSLRFPDQLVASRVALPDDWSRSRPDAGSPVWYRVPFTAVEPPGNRPQGLLGLAIPHACATFSVQLNGHRIYDSGSTDAYAQDCNHPQLVVLPPALVRNGNNVLDLRLAGQRLAEVGSRHRAGGLSTMTIGPLSDLQPTQRLRTAVAVTLPQALGATLLLMGGFMFVLGFFNRRASYLAYFGALSVGWALLDARLWLREWPLAVHTVEVLLSTLLPLVTQAAVQFLLRYGGWRDRRIDICLLLQVLLVPLSLLAAGPQRVYPMTMFWTTLLSLEVAAAAVFYLHAERLRHPPSFRTMAALLALVLLAGLVELAAQRVGTPPLEALLARLVVPLVLVLVGLRLVQQHGRALQQSEAGRVMLEQRVREATAEIERNFRQLSELKIEQVTERERKRIAADLHDDLGAKLLTIVHTSESDRISTLAREALEEMRLSVRGLTGKAVRLADALGDWRAEVVSRLAQAGIEADWSAPEDLPQRLSARAYVQTTRILREATSNIIKHSGATYCSVRCQVADGDFQLIVQDNGDGIAIEPDGRLDRGHGMATMKQRAKQLQGQCLVESGPGFGTVIRLTLPLDRAAEGA